MLLFRLIDRLEHGKSLGFPFESLRILKRGTNKLFEAGGHVNRQFTSWKCI